MRLIHRCVVAAIALLLVSTAAAGLSGTASAAPSSGPAAGSRAAVGGTAAGTPHAVNLGAVRDSAAPAATRTAPRQHLGTKALPSRPTTGQRPAAPAAPDRTTTGPNTHATTTGTVRPLVAPAVVNNFDGIAQAAGCGGCQPPDVNAAVGPNNITESVNLRLQSMTKAGAVQCSIGFNSFLGTSDSLSDPRVQYDNVNDRFSFSITIVPASASATPAIWIGATQTGNPCGGWWIYRLAFSGGSFPAGTLLDYPILGQDRNALLIGTDNFTPSSENFTVFGVQKAQVYAGAAVSFSAFNTASLSAPVSNAGIPMISTPFSYFLSAVPGTGYRLYRMTNSGGPGATLTLQATISSPFNAPSRRVNQPGTTQTLDPLDGRIDWSPVNDGNFIWFAHGFDLAGFPTVRYGAISIASNTPFVAMAYHSGTSDDFNPSVGVSNAPGGGNYIYLNWAYTDTPNNVATSDTVDSVLPGGGVPNLIATGAVLVNGSPTGEFRFGDYSSSTIDPTNAAGSCGLVAQQYFGSDGTWRTRLARVGTC